MMPVLYRVAAIAVLLASSHAFADGIAPGLWKVITKTSSAGETGPPHESSKCLTADQAGDLATTFSPVASTVNSVCAPIERSLVGTRLTWHLACKGQLDMNLSGDFTFDSPRHYTGTVQTQASMGGQPVVDSQNMLEGQWLSACPQ